MSSSGVVFGRGRDVAHNDARSGSGRVRVYDLANLDW